MTSASAADRAGDHHRSQTRADDLNSSPDDEEEGDDAIGEEVRHCECGKTLLKKPAALESVAIATGKHSRRRRRKKPPDGNERRDLFSETSDTAAANAGAIPKIRVIDQSDAGEEEETRKLSKISSACGAIDEGIYDGNSSSIDSSLFGNKSSSSRKSSRGDTNSSREKRGSRRSSYLPTGDAISLMIIDGCELCQEGRYCTN